MLYGLSPSVWLQWLLGVGDSMLQQPSSGSHELHLPTLVVATILPPQPLPQPDGCIAAAAVVSAAVVVSAAAAVAASALYP